MNNLVWSTSWITFIISMEMTGKQRLGKVFKLPKAKLTISDRIKCKPISFDLCVSISFTIPFKFR